MGRRWNAFWRGFAGGMDLGAIWPPSPSRARTRLLTDEEALARDFQAVGDDFRKILPPDKPKSRS